MKYLCLGYHDTAKLGEMSREEHEALVEACSAYDRMLAKNGYCLKGNALPAANAAVTLRSEGGRVCMTPGPFAPGPQQLGGILLLEARDLNHAIQLMSELPAMRHGGAVEIRPIDPTTDDGEPQ